MIASAKEKFKRLVWPRSHSEDTARKEFILNILLSASIVLSIITSVISIAELFLGIMTFAEVVGNIVPMIIFFVLYFLSRRGFYKASSYCLIGIFFLVATYEIYTYGADLPPALLVYVLVIVMTGILIDTPSAFFATIATSFIIIGVGYLQSIRIITVNSYWKKDTMDKVDFVVFAIIFLIIATVSWLSNREIERSLKRARKSEALLTKERDSLEDTLELRTRELRDAQAEKIDQLYRFAEFGRLSSGLFHDLINPLNAISITIESMKNEHLHDLSLARSTIDRAIRATKKMEDLVSGVRKQLSQEEHEADFSATGEIAQVIEVLSHKAQSLHVAIEFMPDGDIHLYGDATKFHYAMLNLVSNAIDSYNGLSQSSVMLPCRNVSIAIKQIHDSVTIFIRDSGSGIEKAHLQKIFEPFFTTKTHSQGIGIGLSMTKRIIEKNFKGTISVESNLNQGTTFTISIQARGSL